MPSLQIRDFPASLHNQLVRRAKQDRRTIAQEATVLLEEALALVSEKERRRAVLDEIKRHPPILDFSRVTPPEELIRADRNR